MFLRLCAGTATYKADNSVQVLSYFAILKNHVYIRKEESQAELLTSDSEKSE